MKKIEKVFSQLSKLYEFNKKLQTYRLKKENNKGQQIVERTARSAVVLGNYQHFQKALPGAPILRLPLNSVIGLSLRSSPIGARVKEQW